MTKDQIAAEIKSTEEKLAKLRADMKASERSAGWYVIRTTVLRSTKTIAEALAVPDGHRFIGASPSGMTYSPYHQISFAGTGWVVCEDWPLVYFNGSN
jgi:hypothetical protein